VRPKTISEAMVHLAQTVHLPCTETNTVSKWTETIFHLSLITQEYQLVHPKKFLSLWYIRRKTVHLPCTETNTISKRFETRFYMTHVT
jgi:hypothetical protein